MFGKRKQQEIEAEHQREIRDLNYRIQVLRNNLLRSLSGEMDSINRAYALYILWKEEDVEEAHILFDKIRGTEELYKDIVRDRETNRRNHELGIRPPQWKDSYLDCYTILFNDFKDRIEMEGK